MHPEAGRQRAGVGVEQAPDVVGQVGEVVGVEGRDVGEEEREVAELLGRLSAVTAAAARGGRGQRRLLAEEEHRWPIAALQAVREL